MNHHPSSRRRSTVEVELTPRAHQPKRVQKQPHNNGRRTSLTLAIFAHTYSAVPFGAARCVPVAVMSSHSAEHSRSTTTLPSFPDEVPVTLMSGRGGFSGGHRRWVGKEGGRTVDVGDAERAGVLFAGRRGRRVALHGVSADGQCAGGDAAAHLVDVHRVVDVVHCADAVSLAQPPVTRRSP